MRHTWICNESTTFPTFLVSKILVMLALSCASPFYLPSPAQWPSAVAPHTLRHTRLILRGPRCDGRPSREARSTRRGHSLLLPIVHDLSIAATLPLFPCCSQTERPRGSSRARFRPFFPVKCHKIR
ncbi:hypothetical protein B0H15DRAFT_175822 [Mycena belliarum]|uniref:Uncharacterized protein n=1 Tax=Mycena belliarum TaxID=1033014 RepID=A0AAD6U788_9AGAR|nr:hypothetical protein B0H15DRAFT_175822 [Mycena belliae]